MQSYNVHAHSYDKNCNESVVSSDNNNVNENILIIAKAHLFDIHLVVTYQEKRSYILVIMIAYQIWGLN
jgi:hypothetical protein